MNVTDDNIIKRVRSIERSIEAWARARELWVDSGFHSFAERVDAEPGSVPVATILYSEGDLRRYITEDVEGTQTDFSNLLKEQGFWFEQDDTVSFNIYPEEDGPLRQPILDYVRWQWLCGLIEPDISDVYEEIYAHFAKRPDDLHRLNWHDFEVLIARSLQHQGFQVELGSGCNDGGVDIRLLQRDPLGDLLTLVQVKRYAPQRKIDALAVQALHGVAEVERAQQSLFVTTSAYLPAARRFANRTNGRMLLATSKDVMRWCAHATDGVIKDKSKLVTPYQVSKILGALSGGPDPRVLHANTGVTMIMNGYALVLKETNHAALLARLPSVVVSDDGHSQVGFERPLFNPANPPVLAADTVWRARRNTDAAGRLSYWDGCNLWMAWDGSCQRFDYAD